MFLIERIKRQPESETLGQGNFFLGGFAGVNLVTDAVRVEVFTHVFRHQVAAVGGGVDQQVVRHAGDGTIQYTFQRLVAGVAGFEGQIVAENDETLWPAGNQVDDVRQVDQILFIHFNQAQALVGIAIQHGFHQRGFARAARAGQQYIVGCAAGHELACVLLDALRLFVDSLQIVQTDAMRFGHGQQASSARLAGIALPAKSHGGIPVGRCGWRGQQGFDTRQQLLGAGKKFGQFSHGG